jgi:crotonobetainyl-CoA:carnitine CoA-transferase CaiB-like acyl-CoA transferase
VCRVIGQPELNDDPRFSTMAGRNENRDELLPILDAAFATRRVDEWIDDLLAAGVPASRINTVEEALVDEQTVARADIVEHEHPVLGQVRTIRTPLRLSQGEESLERPAMRGPTRGEHTAEVLAGLCGYPAEKVRELAAAGAFGDVAVVV